MTRLIPLFALAVLGAASAAKAEADRGAPIVRSVRSGPWSEAATWSSNKVPGAGARVLIRAGHRVTYDVASDEPIRAINVAGTLTFAADKTTRLTVGLIKIQDSEEYSEEGFDCDAHLRAPVAGKERPALEVGTPEQPVAADCSATIRLAYLPGLDRESCPAIVCCGGRMDFHGAPMNRTWVRLGATAKKNAAVVTLAEAVSGWRVGDRVIVTATENPDYSHGAQTEERTIRSIQGTELTLDRPLEREHLGSGDFRGEVANLTRTQRPHLP